jgi:hypothetical protein
MGNEMRHVCFAYHEDTKTTFYEFSVASPQSYSQNRKVLCHSLFSSDGHTFVYSLHRYHYRYIVSNDHYKQTPSVICL